MRYLLFAAVALATASPAFAQYDLTTIEGTIDVLYESISGPEGFEINRDAFDPLWTDNARLSATFTNREGNQDYVTWTPAEYLDAVWNGPRQRGFFEVETASTHEVFGNVAHVFSTYESRWNEDDDDPFQRGINSIQLLQKEGRWWIVSILWQGETEHTPIPEKYL